MPRNRVKFDANIDEDLREDVFDRKTMISPKSIYQFYTCIQRNMIYILPTGKYEY
jgi:hypothetical protein